jgi:aspartate ammonia-lyase
VSDQTGSATLSTLVRFPQKGIRTTAVPHALKIGSEFHMTFDQLVSSSYRNRNRDHGMFVMEFGLGVGVLGKGLKASSNIHETVFADLMEFATFNQTLNSVLVISIHFSGPVPKILNS